MRLLKNLLIILSLLSFPIAVHAQTLGQVQTSSGSWTVNLAPDINDDFTKLYGTPFLTIGNQTTFSTERAITAGTCITATDGGVNSTYTLGVTAGCIGTTQIGTDGVGADELDITSVEGEIESALDTLANVTSIGGDVTAGGDFISTDDIISGDDVLLSNAGAINFGSGDCILTEGTDTLTISGTCVLVTESAGLQIGASVPFSDSAGTLTLQNIDALDATTESTIEASVDLADLGDNYVASVADGTGIDGTATGVGSTYTPTLDLTEISTFTLGSGSATGIIFDAGATDPAIETASGSLTIDIGGTNELIVDASNVTPGVDGGNILGSGSLQWGGLFSSGDISFGNGDVVIDYSANDLSFTGVTGDYSFDDTVGVTGSLIASVDVTATAGDVTSGDDLISGDDVLLSNAGAINFNAGDCVLTEGTDTLTISGTCVLVTENAGLQVGASVPFSDSAGTLTLQNIDVIDATTESTIEAAIDTAANLVSIQGRTVTLADAGANAFFGWDDAAGAYENLTDAEAEAIIEPLIDTLANLASVQGFAFDLDDNNLDELWGWDDGSATFDNFSLADITTEATPAAGDFVLVYGAEGDLRKVDWNNLPGAGSGVDTFLELTDTPDDYTTFAGDCVKVNGTEDGLEFDNCAAGTGDDLGNHTATENLKMATFDIDFGTGDVVIDYSANDLAFTGVTGDYSFDDTVGVTGSIVASVDVIATAGDVTSGDDIIVGDDISLVEAGSISWDAGDCVLANNNNDLVATGCAITIASIEAIDLGTDTAGDYVAAVNDGTGIDGTATGEGSTYTPTLDLTEINTFTLGAGSATGIIFDAGATDPAIEVASGTFTIDIGGTNEFVLNATELTPGADGGSALGTGSLQWAGLFTSADISFANGDVVIDYSANDLAFTGVTGDYSFDDTVGVTGSVTASVDVTATAGDVTSGDDVISGDDVLLSNAGVINFGSGDCTLTEGTDTLTIAGTCVLVTEAAGLQVGSSVPFSDSAGTLTLQNVDVLDATTESTIEAAIDTTANLVSIQGRTVTLADAGANAFFGWDDAAGAYENLTDAEVEAIIEPLLDTLANVTSIQGQTLTLTDEGLDVLFGWDDSDNAYESLSLAEIATEASPASGDFVLVYGAEGDLRKVDWANLPSGSGIANVVEDVDPELGGGLDLNNFDITGTGNINITGSVTASVDVTATTGDVTSGDDIIVGDDILLAAGGVINWAAGDITITNSSNVLGIQGGSTVQGNSTTITAFDTASVPQFQVLGIDENTSSIGIVRFSDNASPPTIFLGKSRNTTIEMTAGAGPQADSGDGLGAIEFLADNGGAVLRAAASIRAEADATIGSADIPGRLVFATTPDGSTTLTDRWNIHNTGHILPETDNTYDIGDATIGVRDIFITSDIEFDGGTTNTLNCTAGSCTIEGNTIYRAGGTDVALADGGTGASLADPGGNRLLAWDDTANAVEFQDAGTGLTAGTTTLDCDTPTETAVGCIELATTAEAETGTDTSRAVTAAGVLAAVTGKKPIWIPAGSLIPRSTNGCTITDFEHPTNDIMERSCNFTQTEQGAGFTVRMPDTWDEGTLTAVFVWTHPATVTNFGVVWQVGCVSTSNDDARDTAIGTQQEIADTGGTTSDQYTTDATPAVTCAGTPAAGDTVYFEFEREPGNGSDTLAVDAWLIGVTLYYNDNAFVEP